MEYLRLIPKNQATQMLRMLALGAIAVIREDYESWCHAEQAVFNEPVYSFCKEHLCNNELANIINWGIQIDDFSREKERDGVRTELYSEIEQMMGKLMA